MQSGPKVLAIDSQYCSPKTSGGAGVYANALVEKIQSWNAHNSSEFKTIPVRVQRHSETKFETFSERAVRFAKRKTVAHLAPQLVSLLRTVRNNVTLKKDTLDPRFRPDITHQLTNYYSGAEVRRWVDQGTRLCVTFLDIQDFYIPDFFSTDEVARRKAEYEFYTEKSTLFFAISEFTKQTMVDRLKIRPENIIVTHLAASLSEEELNVPVAENSLSDQRPYFVYPARYWKHKNHQFLFQAVRKVRDEFAKHGAEIVLTGGFSHEDMKALKKDLMDAGVSNFVRHAGFLSLPDKSALMKRASAMVFPSLFEGFGMPVLEAMQIGCPVFASDRTSIPEIGGDAVEYFDPEKVDTLAAIFSEYFSGRMDMKNKVEKGIVRSQLFSWENTANRTIEGYQRLL